MLSDFIFQKIVPKTLKLNIKAFFHQDNQEIFFLCKNTQTIQKYTSYSFEFQIILLDMEMGR